MKKHCSICIQHSICINLIQGFILSNHVDNNIYRNKRKKDSKRGVLIPKNMLELIEN